MTEQSPRPTLRMPLKNFKPADHVPNLDEWFHAFGRALDQFHRDCERVK